MNFDWEIYNALNPDLNKAGLITKEQITKHYIIHGVLEKRIYDLYKLYPNFNYLNYKNNYSDLNNMNKKESELHWLIHGIKEGRTYSSIYNIYSDFDSETYKNNYPDLTNMNKKELELHWLHHGVNEGRTYKSLATSKPIGLSFNNTVKNKDTQINKISIIMVFNNNLQNQLINTLNSLNNYINKYNFEVIISNVDSCEELKTHLSSYKFDIKYIDNTNSVSNAYTKAVDLSSGDIIFIQKAQCFHVGDLFGYAINNLGENDYLAFSCYNTNSVELNNDLINNLDNMYTYNYLSKNADLGISWNDVTVDNYVGVLYKNRLNMINFNDTILGFEDENFILDIKHVLKLNVQKVDFNNDIYAINQYCDFKTNKLPQNRDIYISKKQYLEKNIFNYPRLLHLYWDGSPFSFLNLCTILSFNNFHKYWIINLFMPEKRSEHISWTSGEQKLKYKEKCYLYKIKDIVNVKTQYINLNKIGFYDDASEVIKSDYFRYYILYKHGGIWSDTDIVYTSSIENKINFNEDVLMFTYVVDSYNVYPIGFFASKQGTQFFRYILDECLIKYDPTKYETLGANLLNKLFGNGSNINRNNNYKNSVKVCDKDYYLPWKWNELDEFLVKYDNTLPSVTFGIHWFNGATQAKEYSINLTKRILSDSFTITCYLDKFISKYINMC